MPTGKKILLLLDWFDPAYKAGGPIRSAVNFAKQMQSDFDIFVFTGDRDLNEIKPLKDVVIDKWVEYAPRSKHNFCRNSVTALQPQWIHRKLL